MDPTVPQIKSVLLLDSDGKRIAVKYFSPEWYAAPMRWRHSPSCSSAELSARRPSVATQAGYEKSVFAKTSRTNARGEGGAQAARSAQGWPAAAHADARAAEITMFDDVIVVYKFVADLMFFVTGSQDDNELILQTVLQAFYESVSLLLRCAKPGLRPPSEAHAV